MHAREVEIDKLLDADAPPRPVARKFKSKRAWQLAILEQMNLPRDLRAYDRPAAPVQLKSLLHTIDNHARESSWCTLPIQDAKDKSGRVVQRGLASESQMSPSQCKRCLRAARDKGWLEEQKMPGRRGSDRCWFRIVFQELARTTTLPLWNGTAGMGDPGTDHVPNDGRPRAQSAPTRCPTTGDHVPNPHRPRAHAGTPQEPPTNRPLCAHEPPPPPTPASDSWAAAVAKLRTTFSIAQSLADSYRDLGRSPEDLLRDASEAIATAELPCNAKLWTKGPLPAAATFLRDGRWPIDNVLTLQQHAEREQERERTAAKARETTAAEERQRKHDAEQRAAYEAKYGPIVDALDRAAIDRLLPKLEEFTRRRVVKSGAPPWPETVRWSLIMALEKLDAQPPSNACRTQARVNDGHLELIYTTSRPPA
jgi:hypothetical protein